MDLDKEQLAGMVAGLKKGERKAAKTFFDYFFDRLYRYFYFRTGSCEEAEDLTSQVFLKVFESIGHYEERGAPFPAWVFRIAHNLLVDYYRRHGHFRIESLEDCLSEAETRTLEIEEKVLAALTLEDLKSEFSSLTFDQQEVLVLRYLEELEISEIAEVMKRNPSAVRALLRRSLCSLAKKIKKKNDSEVLKNNKNRFLF